MLRSMGRRCHAAAPCATDGVSAARVARPQHAPERARQHEQEQREVAESDCEPRARRKRAFGDTNPSITPAPTRNVRQTTMSLSPRATER